MFVQEIITIYKELSHVLSRLSHNTLKIGKYYF